MDELVRMAEDMGEIKGSIKSIDKRLDKVERQITTDSRAVWICRVIIVAIVGIFWKTK